MDSRRRKRKKVYQGVKNPNEEILIEIDAVLICNLLTVSNTSFIHQKKNFGDLELSIGFPLGK